MKLTLRDQLTQFGHLLQSKLFPVLEETTDELSDQAKLLVSVLAMVPLARFIPVSRGWNGRPSKDRYCIACAFVAKAVYNLTTTRQLIEFLGKDDQLRRICGWKRATDLPHESTFSRAFAEFAAMELPQFVHEALIRETQQQRLVGHIARDSTAIPARERFAAGPPKQPQPKFRSWGRGKGKRRLPKTRLERQRTMTLSEMLDELPLNCSLGVKTSSDGNQKYWRGYKLHLDVADGQIPISAILTGASLHDSQVAIPLATLTAQRVTSLYDVMDSAYDAREIIDHSRGLGHVPIINPIQWKSPSKNVIVPPKQPRQFTWAEEDRFRERTMVERVNGRLKDEFGGRHIYVRGAQKIFAHLMFGVLALTVDQLLRLAT
jgi:hypothetical protein